MANGIDIYGNYILPAATGVKNAAISLFKSDDAPGDYSSRKASLARQQKLADALTQMGAQEQAVSSAGGITAPISPMSALARGLTSFGGSYLAGKAAADEAALKKNEISEAKDYYANFRNKPAPYTLPAENGAPSLALNIVDPVTGNPVMTTAPRSMQEQRDYAGEARFSDNPMIRSMADSLEARATPKYENVGALGAMDTNPDSPTYRQIIGAPTTTPTKNPYPAIGNDGKPAMFRDDEFGNPVPVPGMTPYSAPATNVNVKLPPGLNKADETLGAMYAEHITGDTAAGKKNMDQLGMAINYMVKNPNMSGNISGALPIEVRSLFPSLKPGANTQQMVQDVVQTNLRRILGPQFTYKEGEGLMKRVFDPLQPTAVNADRATRLLKSIQEAAQAKDDAMRYFGQNNTISGYKPKYAMVRSVEDIIYNAGLTGVDVSGNKPGLDKNADPLRIRN